MQSTQYVVSSSEVLRRIEGAEAVECWAFYEPFIASVIVTANSGQYPDDVLTCVQLGTMQLWRISDDRGIAVTEIQDYPRYRQLLIYMVAGYAAPSWIAEGQTQLEAFAKVSGCKHMLFHGRPGWEHYCERLGYGHKQILMRKDL